MKKTGEQIVYEVTGRPAAEVLAEEAAANNYTRREVAEQLGLTLPQMDRLLQKHGIAWRYPAEVRRRHGGHNKTRFLRDGGETLPLAEWCRRYGIPYTTAVRWHEAGTCEEKLAERLGRAPRPEAPTMRSDPDAAWAALQRL